VARNRPPSAGERAQKGGHYVLDGGSRADQSQVKKALNASSFDWSVVPATITIHIGRGHYSEATYGQIWLDSNLLDSGIFSWGVVQPRVRPPGRLLPAQRQPARHARWAGR
jgi:hypothetical protein